MGFRNDVMHAHNINYKKYVEAESLISMTNMELELLIIKYSQQRNYLRPDIQDKLNEIINMMFVGNDEQVKDDE
jgi:hypothetical protein